MEVCVCVWERGGVTETGLAHSFVMRALDVGCLDAGVMMVHMNVCVNVCVLDLPGN